MATLHVIPLDQVQGYLSRESDPSAHQLMGVTRCIPTVGYPFTFHTYRLSMHSPASTVNTSTVLTVDMLDDGSYRFTTCNSTYVFTPQQF